MGYRDRAYRVAREGDPITAATYETWNPRMAARRYASEYLDEGESATLEIHPQHTFSDRAWRVVVRFDPADFELIQSMEEIRAPA